MEGSARKNPTTAVTAVRDGGGGRRLPDFRFPFGKKKDILKKKKKIEYDYDAPKRFPRGIRRNGLSIAFGFVGRRYTHGTGLSRSVGE